MFLMAARKRKKQTTSNYLVSLDPEDLDRNSSKYFGKLRANFVGTEFTIFDGGDKAGKAGSGQERLELGGITYQYNVLGTRGPRKMTGVIPALDASGQRLYRPANDADNMLDRCVRHRDRGDDEAQGALWALARRQCPPRPHGAARTTRAG